MEDKVAYLLKEKGKTRTTNWGVVVAEGVVVAYPPGAFVREINDLKKKGYDIIYEDIPIDEIMRGYDKNKYRELNSKEKERLEKLLEKF